MAPQSASGPEFDFSPHPPHQAKDREVTLGPILLSALGAGLLVLCCVCFLAGYEFGHHGAPLPGIKGLAVDSKGPSAAELLAQSQSRPAAATTTPAPRPTAPPTAVVKTATPKDSAPATAAPPAYQLRTAAQTTAPASASAPTQQAPANPLVRPALAVTTQPTAAWRVQIAAVEHSDDADVLVSALRQRGYPVSVHHDVADGLLHVQVGPFPSRTDAEATRQKLLSDGYNAILQP